MSAGKDDGRRNGKHSIGRRRKRRDVRRGWEEKAAADCVGDGGVLRVGETDDCVGYWAGFSFPVLKNNFGKWRPRTNGQKK